VKAGKSQVEALDDLVSGEGLCLVDRQHLLAVSLCVGRGKEILWRPFMWVLIAFTEAPHSSPNYLLKALPPNTVTLGVRHQHVNFGGHSHSDKSTHLS
jgi:hypothetical protein